MPALPWKTVHTPEPGARMIAVATELELARHRDIPAFLRLSNAITADMTNAPGLVGHSLSAHPVAKVFRTVSVWNDVASLNAFVGAGRHGATLTSTPFTFTPNATTRWNCTAEDLPLDWNSVTKRLRAAIPYRAQ